MTAPSGSHRRCAPRSAASARSRPTATPCARCSRISSRAIPALGAQIFSDGEIATFVNVYLGGEDVRTLDGLDTAVAPGQTVILLPAMAGGSTPPRSLPVVSSLLDLSATRRSSS